MLKPSLRQAIRDMIPIIDPDEDYMTIASAEELMSSTEVARKKELEETHAKLKGLHLPHG